MAAVAVLPSGKQLEAAMDVDQPSSTNQPAAEDDLYTRLKTFQRQLEFLEIQVGRRHPCSSCRDSSSKQSA
jgi:hypothetical protein